MTPEEAGRRAEAMAFELISSRLQETSLDGTDLMNPLVPAPTGHQLETILAHSGVQSVMGHSSGGGSWTSRGNEDNIALAPALEMATTYTRPADTRYREDHSIYGREDNPTRRLLELEIAKLECHGKAIPPGEELPKACAFASGMMAASAIILAHQLPLRVILPTDLYMGVPVRMDLDPRLLCLVATARFALSLSLSLKPSFPLYVYHFVHLYHPPNPFKRLL